MFDTVIIEDTLEVKIADFFQKECIRDFRKKIMDISTIVMPALIVPFFSRVGRPKLFS